MTGRARNGFQMVYKACSKARQSTLHAMDGEYHRRAVCGVYGAYHGVVRAQCIAGVQHFVQCGAAAI